MKNSGHLSDQVRDPELCCQDSGRHCGKKTGEVPELWNPKKFPRHSKECPQSLTGGSKLARA